MWCPYCGHKNEPGRKYCESCGALLPDIPDSESVEHADGFGDEGDQANDAAGATRYYSVSELEDAVRSGDEARRNATLSGARPDEDAGEAGGDDADATADIKGARGGSAAVSPKPVNPAQRRKSIEQARMKGSGKDPELIPEDDDYEYGGIKTSLVIGIVLGLVAIVLFVGLGSSCASSQSGDVPDGAIEASTEAETEAATEETDETSAVAVQDTLSDYSWDDLAEISALISDAGSYDEAVTIAEKYHILNSDGTVSNDEILVQLDDGTEMMVGVAGIYHDELADGSGVAGITFVSTTASTAHVMNSENSNAGGWESSEMREWLNSEDGMLGNLPDDLSSHIVEVRKMTDNVGKTTSVDDVTETDDSLWLLSLHEVTGDVSFDWGSSSNASAYNDIMNAEGTQYERFEAQDVYQSWSNDILMLDYTNADSCAWWLRSSSPSVSDHFRYVNEEGNPGVVADANVENGVVFGFCI
jgi:hypothetical protein